MSEHANALSEKNITGECRSVFKKWKTWGGYGAFAIGTNGYCGYAWDNESLAVARNGALSNCRKGGKGKGCAVIRENRTIGSFRKNWNDCFSNSNYDVSIDACTLIIKLKRDSKKDLATAYNDRGVAYYRKGDKDLALSDFNAAIKINGSYGRAYSNRAIQEDDRNQYESALVDYKVALKKYDKNDGGTDYRSADQASIARIEGLLSSIKNFTDDILCNMALTSSKQDWDQTPRYSSHVKEAKKRGLDVASCRALLPSSKPTAQPSIADGGKDCTDTNPDLAIRGCSAIIEMVSPRQSNESLAIAYANRGLAYHNKGEYDRAIKDYDKAIALNPKDPDPYYNLGRTYDSKSDYEKALAYFRSAFTIYPSANRGHIEAQKKIAEMEQKIASAAKAQPQTQTPETPVPQP